MATWTWQGKGRGGEGRGCAQVFAGHHNKHPSSPIPKCCSRLVGDKYSSPTSLSSSNPFWVLPYPCLNFATVYDFDLRDEDLKNTYFTRLNLFWVFNVPVIINLAWYVGFSMLLSTHTYCDKYLNTWNAYAGPPNPHPSQKKLII
jgi:hypothetical protein